MARLYSSPVAMMRSRLAASIVRAKRMLLAH
jgi:hypothetical protein